MASLMADRDSRSGDRYGDAAIFDYTNQVHAGHDAALDAAFSAPDAAGMPAIQVGMSEGRLLELLARLVGARAVVEIGTLAGYSALRMARALPADGRLWTIESEPSHAEVARKVIDDAGLGDRVEVVVGEALSRLPELAEKGPFDLVFIDADKDNYEHYGAWALDNLQSGGLIVADNAFLFGKLMADDERARGMRRFHELVAARCASVCVPSPDGMVIGIVHS